MSEMITITIDGKECSCEKGEYLYDVAKRNGIYIPVLCRHDAFDDKRACCRICIVEVEQRGRTKVVTACVYPIEGECEVRTNTERILKERSIIYALLQHRAPDAQLIKDMSGDLKMDGFERLVSVDSSKCILCGLCVQACNSLGSGAIGTVNRGTEKKVDTPYSEPSEFCVGCLSCANICPTGAIEYTQTPDTRTIWGRTFDIVRCEVCGQPINTEEAIRHAAKRADVEPQMVCSACRRKAAVENQEAALTA